MTEIPFANWPRLYINGRFLIQRQTGVQRFAHETVRALDALLGDPAQLGLRGRAALVTPPGVKPPADLANLRHLEGGSLGRGYAWEQIDLPRLSADGVLLNLCNLAPIAKRRQVVVVHDATTKAQPDAFSPAFRWAYAAMVPVITRRAARIVTISEFSRTEISRWFGVPASRLAVCHEGAEHILARQADRSVLTRYGLIDTPFLLAVGMGPVNKNLPLLLKSFSQAQLGRVRLVLTGNRNPRVHGASALQIPPGVLHVGHVSDAELRALYEAALALVYPSSYEGFGLPPLEAMACGCPVVVSNQAAVLEVVGHAARIVELRGTDELAAALRQLTNDAQLRAQLAELGRQRARRFTWRATAEFLLAQCRAAAVVQTSRLNLTDNVGFGSAVAGSKGDTGISGANALRRLHAGFKPRSRVVVRRG